MTKSAQATLMAMANQTNVESESEVKRDIEWHRRITNDETKAKLTGLLKPSLNKNAFEEIANTKADCEELHRIYELADGELQEGVLLCKLPSLSNMIAQSTVVDNPEVEGSLAVKDDQCRKDPPVIPAVEGFLQPSCPKAEADEKRGDDDEEDVDANVCTARAGRVQWRLMFHRGMDSNDGKYREKV